MKGLSFVAGGDKCYVKVVIRNHEELMRNYFYILLLLLLIHSCGKEVEKFTPTTRLARLLKNEKLRKNYYELRLQTALVSRLDTVRSFKKFSTATTVEELISLTHCEKPIVRCFAFKALVEKDYPKIKDLLLEHQHDEEMVIEYSRCIALHTPVKFYMLSQLEPCAKTKYCFSRNEYERIQKDFSAE